MSKFLKTLSIVKIIVHITFIFLIEENIVFHCGNLIRVPPTESYLLTILLQDNYLLQGCELYPVYHFNNKVIADKNEEIKDKKDKKISELECHANG
jgi:hypothetical protein